jgi:hypothetical protein
MASLLSLYRSKPSDLEIATDPARLAVAIKVAPLVVLLVVETTTMLVVATIVVLLVTTNMTTAVALLLRAMRIRMIGMTIVTAMLVHHRAVLLVGAGQLTTILPVAMTTPMRCLQPGMSAAMTT